MNAVFLDTVGLVTLWDADDQWHNAAANAFASLQASGVVLMTTRFVLMECGNSAARKPYRSAADRLRLQLEQRNLIITATDDDWHLAWSNYRRQPPGSAGIVDQVSFIVMRRLGITAAFTNDKHFRAEGFEILF